MSAAAKKPAKSDARAASIASFMSAMGEPRKVSPKKEAVVVVVDNDDDADDTFASFAEREKNKILDLGIEPDEEYLYAEINRRWELKHGSKSVALKAKATSKGSATVTSSKVVKPEKNEKESAEDGDPPMHMIDTKLDAATAKAMGVEFVGEIKGKFLYKNVKEVKEVKKAKESKTDVAKASATMAVAKPKPSPKAKSLPPPRASLSGSSKKRKAEEAAFKSNKKAKAKDEEEVDFTDLAQSAEHWTQVAAGRLMVKCAHNAEARAYIQGLLNVFGVTLSPKVLSSKSVSLTEVSELARQMHYETDNGEEEEEAEDDEADEADEVEQEEAEDDEEEAEDDEAEDDE